MQKAHIYVTCSLMILTLVICAIYLTSQQSFIFHRSVSTTVLANPRLLSFGAVAESDDDIPTTTDIPPLPEDFQNFYITTYAMGRLGNQMLTYANLFAVASRDKAWIPFLRHEKLF